MRVFLFLLLAVGFTPISTAQSPAHHPAVRAVIDTFFDGLLSGDTLLLGSTLAPGARILSPQAGKLRILSAEAFLKSVGNRPSSRDMDEKLWNYDIRVDGPIASVWTDYTFYLDGQVLHCGANSFELVRLEESWKITQIIDSRRKEGCQTEPEATQATIHRLLDNWHRAAAEANEDLFFGSMAPQGIYLGTDSTERWSRQEMAEWAAPYFERETAWAFTPSDRFITLNPSHTIAWFDESLDTWMGSCRGSGVLRKYPDGWRIEQYNLAVTIPNEDMDNFLELIRKSPRD